MSDSTTEAPQPPAARDEQVGWISEPQGMMEALAWYEPMGGTPEDVQFPRIEPALRPVVVCGTEVPFLGARTFDDGTVDVTLDRRMTVSVPPELVDVIVPFMADCIAVGLGYTSHPREGAPSARPRGPYRG